MVECVVAVGEQLRIEVTPPGWRQVVRAGSFIAWCAFDQHEQGKICGGSECQRTRNLARIGRRLREVRPRFGGLPESPAVASNARKEKDSD